MSTVLLVGKGPSARPALDSLAEKFDVVGVIRNARPSGGQEDEVQRRADELNVPVLTDTSVPGVERAIIEYCPDCTVMSFYDRILSARILDLSRFVNVHYSLLPDTAGWPPCSGESSTVNLNSESRSMSSRKTWMQGISFTRRG